MNPGRRRGLLLGALMLLLVGLGFLAKFLFPLEIYEFTQRTRMYWAGAHAFESAGIKGFERDFCEGTTETCSCIALIHGLGDDAYTWSRLLSQARAPLGPWKSNVRLVAVHLPETEGSGPSANGRYGPRDLADALKTALAPVCRRWVVVGNSLGGWIALWMALDWPEGVERLVLLAPAGLRSKRDEATKMALGLLDPTSDLLKEFQKRAYAKPADLPDSVFRAVAKRLRSRPVRKTLEAIKDSDFIDDKLALVRAPAIVLAGLSDQIVPPTSVEALAKGLPIASFQKIEACGHMPQKECTPVVIKAIEQSLAYGSF